MMRTIEKLGSLCLLLAAVLLAGTPAFAGGDWNDKGVAWRPYAQGITEAKQSNKPVCLVFYTEWCPHCTAYSKLFHDPKVVEKAKSFVMIRLDNDKEKELAAKYSGDGQYIPRTFFLSPAGEFAADLTANPDKYKYFYGEGNPDPLLAGMDRALKKFGGKAPAAATGSTPAAGETKK